MILQQRLQDTQIILASQSPRRQHLLQELQVPFEVAVRDGDENFPEDMGVMDVPAYLAQQKSDVYADLITENTLLITADTVVILDNNIINKPAHETEAHELLNRLSGQTHLVVTGVCLRTTHKRRVFSSLTKVKFRQLLESEITYYIDRYKPYDKAGAYGIQEWIGYVGVEKIEGSFYNVMGLPTQQLYVEMLNILK